LQTSQDGLLFGVRFRPFFRHHVLGEHIQVEAERALLERARAYDEEALTELYDQYAPRIYAYIYRRVSDARLAEDLTGEVFVRVLQAIRSERFWHTSFSAWLYRIAHNLVVDQYRQQGGVREVKLDERLVATQEDPDVALDKQLSHQSLRAAISRLTTDQQQVLVLRFGEQMTAREVAEIMDKTTGAVEALQHRALGALRHILRRE
jgi:RNA polymerase sigma-70 factor (ECF subfamily)